jgi:RNA polymerase sigma-70 factor (ECF subfamily)
MYSLSVIRVRKRLIATRFRVEAVSVARDLTTTSLHDLIGRFQQGDGAALDELIRRCGDRLERLARKMLRGFPVVRRMEGTGDVLQNSLLRLSRSLHEVCPPSTEDFFRLAAAQVRRELLNLAQRHQRRSHLNQPFPQADTEGSTVTRLDPADDHASDALDLDRWSALHEAVENLPDELREVFSLTFYYGATQKEIARVLGVSDRQVRRLWGRACLRLNDLLDGEMPGL